MAKIEEMIATTVGWLKEHRRERGHTGNYEAWMAGTRLHALLDCYEAVGGSAAKWRNDAKILRNPLP